ncbi:excalibur calcium-binding domain-containing protein [Streptomyces sp. 4.24]|uniref:excalibur calcium-binding domain-containing protein n=1 Tax=Streptomyces tritrimontium TaxID=3406573 RepID=UPI003BB632BE
MFQRIGDRGGRAVAAAAVAGVLALALAGCEGADAPKGADKPGAGALPSPSASSAPPVMPSLIGRTSADAEALVKPLAAGPVEARSAYGDVALAADHAQWTVCFQTPAAASPLPPGTGVEISLTAPGTPCPERAGAALRPATTPSPTPARTAGTVKTPAPAVTPAKPKPPASSPTPAPGPKDVYYKNCTEAKAAGVTPIHRGEPGYGKHLDRDNDGIACDK